MWRKISKKSLSPLVVLEADFVVPLLQPRQVLLDDGEERGQSLGGPAVLFGDFGGVCGDSPAEFKGVPAGPGDEEGRVGVAAHLREADEAFLRDVEGAAQAPVARLPEVGGAVLGRGWEAADLVLLAAALLGLGADGAGFLDLGVPPEEGHRHFGAISSSRRWSAPGAFPIGSLARPEGLYSGFSSRPMKRSPWISSMRRSTRVR